KCKTPILGASAESGAVVHALLIRPSLVVDKGLSKVITVVEGFAGDVQRAGIKRVELNGFYRGSLQGFELLGKFCVKIFLKLRHLWRQVSVLFHFFMHLDHQASARDPGPGPEAQDRGVNISPSDELLERRIDPAIEWNIGAGQVAGTNRRGLIGNHLQFV